MKYFIVPLLALVAPIVVAAQNAGGVLGVINAFNNIVSALVPLGIGLALVVFIWGILKYVIAKDEDQQKEARSIIIYGVIILFVIVSVWGLVGLLAETLGIQSGGTGNVSLPGIPR